MRRTFVLVLLLACFPYTSEAQCPSDTTYVQETIALSDEPVDADTHHRTLFPKDRVRCVARDGDYIKVQYPGEPMTPRFVAGTDDPTGWVPQSALGPDKPTFEPYGYRGRISSEFIGATRYELQNRYGDPDEVNSTITSSGTRYQLVYTERGSVSYVYIENGRVTTIQND